MHNAETINDNEDPIDEGKFKIEKISILYIGESEGFSETFCEGSQLFEVKYIANPIVAYEGLKTGGNLPEVIICDRHLTGMAGLQLCEIIRKNDNLKKLGVYFKFK